MALLLPKVGSTRFNGMPWSQVTTTTPADTTPADTTWPPWTTQDVGIPVAEEDFVAWFFNVTEWELDGLLEMDFEGFNAYYQIDEFGGGLNTLTMTDDRDDRWGGEIIATGFGGIEHPVFSTDANTTDFVEYQTGGNLLGFDANYSLALGDASSADLIQKYLDGWAEDRFIIPIVFSAGYTIEREEDPASPGTPVVDVSDTGTLAFDGAGLSSPNNAGSITIDFTGTGLSGNTYTRSVPVSSTVDADFDMDGDGETENSVTDVSSGLSFSFTLTPSAQVAAV